MNFRPSEIRGMAPRALRTRRLHVTKFLLLLFLLVGTTLSTPHVFAEATFLEGSDESNSDGNIEVEYSADVLEPYKSRRTNWSFVFGVAQERLLPSSFSSTEVVDGEAPTKYETLFGSKEVEMLQLTTGMKYNLGIGALNLEGIISSGSILDNRSGRPRRLELTKRGVLAGITLDSLFKEPYVAPYANLQVFEIDYADKGSTTGNTIGTTAPTTAITIGTLFQLNYLDPHTAIRSNSEYGLNNTYLDIFLTKYNTSNGTKDPDLETAFVFGAGLKLEF